MRTTDDGDWISGTTRACQFLACGRTALDALIADGQITVRHVERSWPKYLRSDLEAVREATTRHATRRREPEAVPA